jgi:hypothetical protein
MTTAVRYESENTSMKYNIEITVRDGENGNAPEQRIMISLDSKCPAEAIAEYAAECAAHAAGCFGHVDPVVSWWIYCDGVLIESSRL